MVDAQSADVIATLLRLKADVEKHTGTRIRLTLSGATEAHLLAKEIAEAGVGVVLVPVRPFPFVWETRRVCVSCIFYAGQRDAEIFFAVFPALL